MPENFAPGGSWVAKPITCDATAAPAAARGRTPGLGLPLPGHTRRQGRPPTTWQGSGAWSQPVGLGRGGGCTTRGLDREPGEFSPGDVAASTDASGIGKSAWARPAAVCGPARLGPAWPGCGIGPRARVKAACNCSAALRAAAAWAAWAWAWRSPATASTNATRFWASAPTRATPSLRRWSWRAVVQRPAVGRRRESGGVSGGAGYVRPGRVRGRHRAAWLRVPPIRQPARHALAVLKTAAENTVSCTDEASDQRLATYSARPDPQATGGGSIATLVGTGPPLMFTPRLPPGRRIGLMIIVL